MPKHTESLKGWNIRNFAEGGDLGKITDELFRIHSRWQVTGIADDVPSHALVASKPLEDLLITFIDIPPVDALRDAGEINSETDDRYSFILVLEGEHRFSQYDKELVLKPGMVTVWNMSQPTRFQTSERFKLFSLIVPGKQMRALLPGVDNVCLQRLDTSYGEGFLLASHMRALADTVNHKSWFGTRAIAEASLQFAVATIQSSHLMRDLPHSRPSLYHEIREYISEHLNDPLLNPQSIADHFSISVTYLHRIFQQDAFTVAGLIRFSRLQLSRNRLADSAFNHLSITELCYECGFSDSSHFSRLFQKEFGLRPSDVRRAQ